MHTFEITNVMLGSHYSFYSKKAATNLDVSSTTAVINSIPTAHK
jgi:hypothetical protein